MTLHEFGHSASEVVPPVQEVLDQIDRIHTLEDPAQQEEAWHQLRMSRDVRGVSFEEEAQHINIALVNLVQQGRTEEAYKLITPSGSEMTVLGMELVSMDLHEEERERLNDTLLELVQQKQEEFFASMAAKGLDVNSTEDVRVVDIICNQAFDPEEALKLPAEFWTTFKTFPPALQETFACVNTAVVPLDRAAEIASMLAAHGLAEEFPLTLLTLAAIPDAAGREHYITSLQSARKEVTDTEMSSIDMGALRRFEDPSAALALARQLKIDLSGLQLVVDAYRENLVKIDASTAHLLVEVSKNLGDAASNHTGLLATIQRAVKRADDPEFPEQLIEGLRRMEGKGNNDIIRMIANSAHPLETVNTLRPYRSQFDKLTPELSPYLEHAFTVREKDPVAFVEKFFLALNVAEKNQLPLDSQDTAQLLYKVARGAIQQGPKFEMESVIEDTADRFHIEKFTQRLAKETEEAIAANTIGDMKSTELKDFPQLQATFERLAIPEAMSKRLFKAWSSYSLPFAARWLAARERDVDMNKIFLEDITTAQFKWGGEQKAKTMKREMAALRTYIRQYGLEETVEQHATFNTTNFGHTRPERLHNQLVRWYSDDVPKNIAFSSATEHSVAFKDYGNEIFDLLGEDGTFLFEDHNKAEISRGIIAVGERDRRQGRNPLENPTVESIFLGGHGNATGIEAGEEAIEVEDYIKAAQGRKNLIDKTPAPINVRPNDYSRHIGNKYRVIFIACEVSAEAEKGENIAQTMSTAHGVETHGSTKSVIDMVEITPSGDVIYTTREGKDIRKVISEVHMPAHKNEE